MIPRRVRPPLPPRAATFIRLFAYALAGSLVFTFLPLPWRAVGIPFAAAAVVLGVVAMVVTRHERSPGLWTLLIVGFSASSLLALEYGITALLYRELHALEECTTSAITIAAADRCYRDFEEAARTRMEELGLPSAWNPDPEP